MSDTISMKLFNGWLVAARVRVSVNNAWKFALQSTGQRAVRLHQALTVCFYCSASGTADSLTIDHERTASFWSFLAALCLRKRCSSCRPCVVAIVYQVCGTFSINPSAVWRLRATTPRKERLRHFDTSRARERERESLIGDALFSGRETTCFVTNNPNFITARSGKEVEIVCTRRERDFMSSVVRWDCDFITELVDRRGWIDG